MLAKNVRRLPPVSRTRSSIFLAACIFIFSHWALGACDLNATTSNFSSQLAAAQPGQTICLATGNYGTFNGLTKSSPGVTITAAAGATPTMSIWFGTTASPIAWMILDHLTITGGEINAPANHVTIQNSTITNKIDVWQNGGNNSCSSCPAMNNQNIVFDGDTFNMSANPSGSGGYEGRLNFLGTGSESTPAGVVVKNSTFTQQCADGVDILSGGYGVTIGPGNEFYNLMQGSCGPHIDSIQFVGTDTTGPLITGNYLHDNSTGMIGYDYANDATITNNVVANIGTDGTAIAGNATGTISHNTLYNNQLSCGVTHQGNVCRSAFLNNIATGITNQGGGTGSPSQNDYNLYTQGACGIPGCGSHNLKGTPTYVGGSNPNTYSGFALTSTSLGHLAASDGTDIGMNDSTTGVTPAAPTGLTAAVQ
jgi:hypothetical protein